MNPTPPAEDSPKPPAPLLGALLPKFSLSLEQKEAIERILKWYKTSTNKTFRLGGYAGSGKTTLIKHILADGKFGAVACAAFTGKAADVLTRKGVKASTIHALIYDVNVNDLTGEVTFDLKTRGQLDLDLIIIDEASMVSVDLYKDLLSFHIPILFVGDPGQLEPVGENPNLMREPDFTLQTIHRQALESPIIQLAHEVRNRDISPRMFGDRLPALSFISKNLTREQIESPDQIICAKNMTRTLLNQQLRRNKGYRQFDGYHEGEKLICLRNNRTLGFFNGQVLWVEKIVEQGPIFFKTVVRVDGTGFKQTVPIWTKPFFEPIDEVRDRPSKEWLHCDFGYAITCHKSQGSEWRHVLVVDEWMPPKYWEMKRWRYTAITRASEKLTYAM